LSDDPVQFVVSSRELNGCADSGQVSFEFVLNLGQVHSCRLSETASLPQQNLNKGAVGCVQFRGEWRTIHCILRELCTELNSLLYEVAMFNDPIACCVPPSAFDRIGQLNLTRLFPRARLWLDCLAKASQAVSFNG